MKRKSLLPFCAGMIASMVLCVSITTAMAVSGGVTFNQIDFLLNGLQVAQRNKPLQSASGMEIPSTITYTDAKGGGTTYVPLRAFANALHLPIEWDAETSRVEVLVSGELRLHTLPLTRPDTSAGSFTEVLPAIPISGKEIFPSVLHRSDKNYEKELVFNPANGNHISLTVTNHASHPVEFGWGYKYNKGDGEVLIGTQVPAGQTVTRAIEIESSAETADKILLFVGYTEDFKPSINATISAVQFGDTVVSAGSLLQ